MSRKHQEARPYHHGDLRAELLAAALSVAEERGVDGLSLRECARRAGVSHAAPYRHFADKNALLDALAAQGFGWLADAGRQAMSAAKTPRARLDAYGVAYVLFAVEHPIHFRLMFTRELQPPASAPPVDCTPDMPPAPDDAFGLLVQTASEATGTEGDAALLAGVASWCLPHGLAMLILDGRIPSDRVASSQAIAALAQQVLALSRRADET
jgi:AcrR family transcriptional regulator